MITARFRILPWGSVHMYVSGHAGSAPRGEDLVCSGATTLAYTLGQAVQFFQEQGALVEKPTIAIREGEAEITALPRQGSLAMVMNAFWVAQCGFYVLAHNYPEFVTLDPMKV